MSDESITSQAASSQAIPENERAGAFLASSHIFDRLLNWLIGLVQLTNQEQEQAGIDLSNQGR
jgi:hypothetical protein